MSNPHEFLVGKEPIKEVRCCPKCGSPAPYYSGGQHQCELCNFTEWESEFPKRKIATIDWEKFARSLR